MEGHDMSQSVYEQTSEMTRKALLQDHLNKTYEAVSAALAPGGDGVEEALKITKEATPQFIKYGGLER